MTIANAAWAAALLVAGGAAAMAADISAPTGEIRGLEEDGLNIYQGIPYAEAPTGDRRWAAPVAKAPFAEPFEATSLGAECVQKAVFWRPGSPASTDEDCLSLTVYAPAGTDGPLPVFVGFHGGGSVNGSKTDWDPRRLAADGNVVVTVNYRLGVTGFFAMPELAGDDNLGGNYGDLDRTEALRWVQRNISAFGGDPGKVTIAGQSAGARGVCFQLASPEAAGLFHGAIIQSGPGCAAHTIAQAAPGWEDLIRVAGCADAPDRLACMRDLSPAELIDAQGSSDYASRTIIGGNGLPGVMDDLFAAGEFNRVPVIIGNTRNERRAFTYEANDLMIQPVTMAKFEAYVRDGYPDRADTVLERYSDDAQRAPGLALANLASDERMCTTTGTMQALSMHVPVHVFEFRDETAPGRPYMVIPSSFPIGSGHSAELPYLYGSLITGELDGSQMATGKAMRGYWSALSEGDGLEDWPTYSAAAPKRMLFLENGATEVISEAQFMAEHNCDLVLGDAD
ncbi:carboxylesterase/lipase family protein [Mangrovicoccus sp. HB161399]|uniref:carboxylesterase/lipase family protein n=1 Tax=Mangrovicoccus sp. HB161399 TaxID=2720392 RepID=UPI0015567995|nr:carboxylesterase family protein [Mangrovicoccus sp. HB161399]